MQRKKEITEKFIAYYKNQDVEKRREIRESFLERTMLSYPAWFSKISRKCFSPLEMKLLCSLCGLDFSQCAHKLKDYVQYSHFKKCETKTENQ